MQSTYLLRKDICDYQRSILEQPNNIILFAKQIQRQDVHLLGVCKY